mmetsp:Transcript_20392/g.43349  ORF Transcript_20392/g.43349 Transcript_20392/m.43349 type:complete len:247 (-) Transcript_20392:172-912(-)
MDAGGSCPYLRVLEPVLDIIGARECQVHIAAAPVTHVVELRVGVARRALDPVRPVAIGRVAAVRAPRRVPQAVGRRAERRGGPREQPRVLCAQVLCRVLERLLLIASTPQPRAFRHQILQPAATNRGVGRVECRLDQTLDRRVDVGRVDVRRGRRRWRRDLQRRGALVAGGLHEHRGDDGRVELVVVHLEHRVAEGLLLRDERERLVHCLHRHFAERVGRVHLLRHAVGAVGESTGRAEDVHHACA